MIWRPPRSDFAVGVEAFYHHLPLGLLLKAWRRKRMRWAGTQVRNARFRSKASGWPGRSPPYPWFWPAWTGAFRYGAAAFQFLMEFQRTSKVGLVRSRRWSGFPLRLSNVFAPATAVVRVGAFHQTGLRPFPASGGWRSFERVDTASRHAAAGCGEGHARGAVVWA
jgi:hypothetical protein